MIISCKVATAAMSVATMSVLACMAVWVIGRWWTIHAYAQQPVSVTSYVMQQEDYRIENRNEIVLTRALVAQRSDGSRVTQVTPGDGGKGGFAGRTIEMSDGTYGMIEDSLQAKSTARRSPAEMASAKAAQASMPANCVMQKETSDGEEILAGVRTVKIVPQSTTADRMRRVYWRAPALNCIAVQDLVQTRADANSSWVAAAGKRLVSLSIREPEAKLFENPSNYEEMKPSDLKRKHYRAAGETEATCPQCFADAPGDGDKKYLEGR